MSSGKNYEQKKEIQFKSGEYLFFEFILTDLFAIFHEAHGIPGNSVSLG